METEHDSYQQQQAQQRPYQTPSASPQQPYEAYQTPQSGYVVPDPSPAASPIYLKSCLSAAWEDIRATDGWLVRCIVLGLIACVPILNFVVAGCLLSWSREVPFGARTPMPKKCVTGRNFEMGFYAFLVSLVIGLVCGIVGVVLSLIPLIGWIGYIACIVVGQMATFLLQMRMIMGNSLADGFKVKDAWEASRGSWGQLLAISVVPELVGGVAVFLIALLVLVIALVLACGSLIPFSLFYSVTDALSSAAYSMGIVVAVVAFVVAYVIDMLIMTFCSILSYRAMGHWVALFVPQWTGLAYYVTPGGGMYPPITY